MPADINLSLKTLSIRLDKSFFENIQHPTLSQAAIETLAIIAYKQPVTRVEIEEIRGVNCEMMLKKLQARGLIEAKDRLDVVGKPLLYQVTDTFFRYISIRDDQRTSGASKATGRTRVVS